jgi:hypothetical protein
MSRRAIVIAPTILLLGLAGAGLLPGPESAANPLPIIGPQWIVTPPVTPMRVPIMLTFWNSTGNTVYVHDTSPWWITDSGGNTVYSGGVALQMVVTMPPVTLLTWSWRQQNDTGLQVPAGDYVAHIKWGETALNPNAHEMTAKIHITADLEWSVEPHIASIAGSLQLKLLNSSLAPLHLHNDAPWHVENTSGATVYTPVRNPADITLAPGESRQWSWNPSSLTANSYIVEIDVFATDSEIPRKVRETIRLYTPGTVAWGVFPVVQSTRSVVGLELMNATADTIWIPHWPAFWIERPLTTHIFDPLALQAIFPVPPGTSMAWAWDERDNTGASVTAGQCWAKVSYGTTRQSPGAVTKTAPLWLVEPLDCAWVQSTDEDPVYCADEAAVHFQFANCATDTVGQIAGYVWWIGNAFGVPVDWPDAVLWYLPHFAPGDGFTFTWPRTDALGNPAPTGMYYAFVDFTDKYYRTHYLVMSNPVWISDTAGPCHELSAAPPRPQIRSFAVAPNPFNPRLQVTFEVAAPTRARLEIFDVRGQRLRTLLPDGEIPAGRRVIPWDGLDDRQAPVPGGVYVFRLVTPGDTRSLKATLVK